jgi:hypothetical protein
LRRSRDNALAKSRGEIGEILDHDGSIYKKFAVEHGLKLGTPTSLFAAALRKGNRSPASSGAIPTSTPWSVADPRQNRNITQKFFEEVAVQVRRTF